MTGAGEDAGREFTVPRPGTSAFQGTVRPVIQDSIPSVDDSRRLRVEAGLGPRTLEAASRALPNSLFAAQIRVDGQVIGMGRVIGDGGSFYQVVGIAVVPTL